MLEQDEERELIKAFLVLWYLELLLQGTSYGISPADFWKNLERYLSKKLTSWNCSFSGVPALSWAEIPTWNFAVKESCAVSWFAFYWANTWVLHNDFKLIRRNLAKQQMFN